MPIDPRARAVLDQIAAAGIPPAPQLSVSDARAALVARRAQTAGAPEPLERVEERSIPSPAGQIRVRAYWPRGDSPLPVLVYFHGGGWVLGNLDTHDPVCRGLTNAGGCLVVSVDYRLAPEHPFPAAAEDAYAATKWIAEHSAELGADGSRLAVGGDSAGGNLAAVVCLMARDRGGPPIAMQLLNYPVLDSNLDTPSYRQNADGYGLTRDDMIWYWNHYVPVESDRRHPYAAPLRAADPSAGSGPGLGSLPPALVITAEYDPLRDEGEAYAARLAEAGVSATHSCYPGMIHGFMAMASVLEAGRTAIQEAGRALRHVLAPA